MTRTFGISEVTRGGHSFTSRHSSASELKKSAAAAAPDWKENARTAEFTKRAPSGGRYILSPFLHCWSVDYCEKKSKKRQQLSFAHTLDEAKAIAEADSRNRGGQAP
jgi:hypothetical protein